MECALRGRQRGVVATGRGTGVEELISLRPKSSPLTPNDTPCRNAEAVEHSSFQLKADETDDARHVHNSRRGISNQRKAQLQLGRELLSARRTANNDINSK